MVIAAGLTLVPAPATAVESPVVVQLPSQLRAMPRLVSLRGQTSDGDLVFFRESDPAGNFQGAMEPEVAAAGEDPRETDLTWETVVVGNRLVRQPGTNDPTGVSSRLVGDDWATTPVPAGYRYLNFTRDGLLLAQGEQGEPETLAVSPWSGGSIISLGAVPAGVTVWPRNVRDNDSSQALVHATSADPTADLPLVVDTRSGATWSLGTARPQGCDLGSSWSIHDGVVAWLSRNAEGICTAAASGSAGARMAVTLRELSSAPAGAASSDPLSLLPVGDDVLVWRDRVDDTWGSAAALPLRAVAPNGSSRVLAPSVGSVVPTTSGQVTAVTGESPGVASVRDYRVATGTSSEVRAVEPIAAWVTGVAVDGARALVLDDSGVRGALREQSVRFDSASAGDPSLLDTTVRGPLVAASGATAWNKISGMDGVHRNAAGTRTPVSSGAMVGTDGRWVAYSGGSLLDTTTGGVRQSAFRFAHPVFQDGVSYDVGSVVPGGTTSVVIATDAASRSAAALQVTGCPTVTSVDVAGSWMLVQCYQAGGGTTTQLVDRTGAQASQQIAAQASLYLGNGFLVARTQDGALTWRPANASASSTWQPLGTTLPKPGGGAADSAVAVSRSNVPSVLWTTGRTTRAARLPVAISPMPARPTDVAPPTITGARAAGINQAVVVRWDPADPAARVTQYDVTARSNAFGSRSDTRQYAGSAHDASLAILTNGAAYTVQVTAWNIAGSTTTTLAATPRPAPAAPTNVKAVLDSATGRVDVTWDHADVSGSEPVSSFSVAPNLGGPKDLPPTTRSASFAATPGDSGPITVTAHGLEQSQSASAAGVTSQAPDTVAPSVAMGALPVATLTGGSTLRLSATDARMLAPRPLEVRWRYASAGRRLGGWVYPAAWRRLPAGSLSVRLADGQTGCYSARAHDQAGNASAWSAPRCTSAALDDRRFARTGAVRAKTGSRYFRSTALTTSSAKSVLRLGTLNANRTWLIASTCRTCGQLRVLLNGRVMGTINLRSSAPRDRALIPLLGSTPRSGRLELRPVRNRQPVIVDGLVVQAH